MNIPERRNKDGKITSYRIRVFDHRDTQTYRQFFRTLSIKYDSTKSEAWNRKNAEKLLENLKKTDSSSIETNTSGTLIVKDQKLLPEVLRFIADNTIPFVRIEKQEATLEDIFIDAIQN